MSAETYVAVVVVAVCAAILVFLVGMFCYSQGRRDEARRWLRWAESHPNKVVSEAWINEALRGFGYRCTDSPEILGHIPFAQPVPETEVTTHA